MNAVDRGEHEQEIARELEKLRARLTGTLVEPDDPLYDDARRVWNGMVDVRPRAVVRASAVSDIDPVLAAVQHTELPLAVRGGGHNVAGHGTVEGGLVLDLGALRRVEVDPQTRRVTVEPGATLADVDRATVPHGLAVPLGVVSATGVAGLTLGGGVGWLTRSNGLSLDNLVDAEVITGTREHLHADAEHNPDLFWGIRGGGGNYGVVTSFTFRARELPRPCWAET
ncbi:FAD-binding oxidoreductase [Kocuria nitroreducens]|uniref:FAD-binding oxidoreductase n=1 Tax=Kocuria nitroreducens TaxID=3058914 RepID=UPI0036D80E41